jgi:hypothetical protein
MSGDETCGDGVRPVVQAEVLAPRKTMMADTANRFVIPLSIIALRCMRRKDELRHRWRLPTQYP